MPIAAYVRLALLSINLLLGALAYKRNSRSITNVLLTILTLLIFIWGIANEFSVNAATATETLWWARIVIFFAVPLTITFFLLMYSFPRVSLPLPRKYVIVIGVLTIFGMLTSVSPYTFIAVGGGAGKEAQPIPGPGIVIFFVTAIIPIFLGLFALLKKNWVMKGIEKTQVRYLLAGTLIMYGLIFSFVVIPVIFSRNAAYVAYAPLFTLPFIATTTYAIVRHRLMDIKAAIFRVLGFSLLSGGFFVIYGFLVFFVTQYLSNFGLSTFQHSIIAISSVALAFPIFRYYRSGLQKITDQFLFHNRINYQQALVKLGEDLSGTIVIAEVTEIILRATREVVRSKKTAILLQESPGGRFLPRAFEGMPNFNVNIPNTHALLQHLRHSTGPLVKDEITLLQERERESAHVKELTAVQKALVWLDAAVILPLFVNRHLTGIILLGDKLSGQPYLQDDIEFLAAFAPQAATALENARLYRESLEFGEKLKQEVHIATQELATANTQLKDLDKVKSEFLSIASHQLYTPLTALRGYLSMISEGDYGPVASKQRPIIDILQQSVTRLVTLIKDLLDISRIESGRLELNLESLDVVKMVDDLVRDLMPNAINKKLRLRFHPSQKPVAHVVGDAQRLRQVMLNMIDNAIKYTEAGNIDVRLDQQADEIIFSVTDTGKGLAADEISRLFNKFTRVGGATRYHTEGSGLGLYVAKQIVHEHHGDVVAESPGVGKGSTFSVRLPIEGATKSLKVGERATVIIKATADPKKKE